MISGIANDAKTTARKRPRSTKAIRTVGGVERTLFGKPGEDLSPDHQQPKINGSLDSGTQPVSPLTLPREHPPKTDNSRVAEWDREDRGADPEN